MGMGRSHAGDAGTGDDDLLPLLAGPLSPRFERRVITVAPGGTRPYVDDEWRDSLVVLTRGEIELECVQGGRRRFSEGTVLWLRGLALLAVHNCGARPAVIVAVSRRR